jgi:tetratricopeptide (TPR) repeat protein
MLDYLRDGNVRQALFDGKKRSVVETLMSASYFRDMAWKLNVLGLAKVIMDSAAADHRLLARWSYRNTAVHRMYGRPLNPPQVPGLAAIIAQMLIRTAYDHLRNNRPRDALNEILQYKSIDNPSHLDKVTLTRVALERGRILQCLGQYKEALQTFLSLSKGGHLSPPSQCRLICYTAETCCEDDQPEKAVNWLMPEVESMHEMGWSTLNRVQGLLLALGEAYFQQAKFPQALEVYDRLLSHLQGKGDLNMASQIRLVRVHIGLARIGHKQGDLDRAEYEWGRAQSALDGCGWEPGFTHGVILSSLSDIHLQRGDDNAEELRLQGEDLLRLAKSQHWMACVATKWMLWIRSRRRLATPLGDLHLT